jgi:hypothetical protein
MSGFLGRRQGNINTFVLKSYIRSAAIFGGICHPFRRVLSSVVSLYSATSIDPKIEQAIGLGLFSTELKLSEALLVAASAIYQVFVCHLLILSSPSVREDSVCRYLVL